MVDWFTSVYWLIGVSVIIYLVIRICFEFRISDFEFISLCCFFTFHLSLSFLSVTPSLSRSVSQSFFTFSPFTFNLPTFHLFLLTKNTTGPCPAHIYPGGGWSLHGTEWGRRGFCCDREGRRRPVRRLSPAASGGGQCQRPQRQR